MKQFLVVLLVASAGTGVAAADSAPPYGAGGCGLGSVVFGSKPGFVQLLAATTNFVLFNQTFGITSGTLNCSASADGTVATHEFIQTNREAFAKDISRGSGETIEVVSALGGCADVKAVARTLQKNFKHIFPSAKATELEISGAAVGALKANKELACTVLI